MGRDVISCRAALSAVYEFLDGELDEVSGERVRAHFEACGRCYPHLRLEESFREALRRACAGEKPPPDLRSRLQALLHRERGA
jgi:mycothiol system anti-sigma-R factor